MDTKFFSFSSVAHQSFKYVALNSRCLPDGANFFPIGTQQPKPVVRPVANEIAMLRNQETIAVLAGRNNFEFDSGTNEMLFTVRAIDNVKHTRSCPRLAQEVNESSVGGKLWPRKTSKDRFHLVAVLWMNQHRWIFSVGSDLP